MNDQVRKIIKASFCPKQKWVKDEDAITCFKCDKKFHVLYRRKHHCRYCGQVFCNICSEYSLSGMDLGVPQKAIRMCEACYQKCWKYIAKHNEQYIEYRKSGEHQYVSDVPSNINEIQQQSKTSSFSEEQKLKDIQSIIEEYSSSQINNIKKLEQEINVRFLVLLQVILKQSKIPLKYLPQISRKAQEIVTRMPPNFVITGNMNVCQNTRIKGFYGEKFSMQLQPIVLIKKKFTSKRIKDQYEQMTCILVYGSIESEDLVGQNKEVSFENMINNRIKELKKIISYCERVKINLIFLEGIIEKQFDDEFLKSGITVIPKVKIEYLSRLKASVRIDRIVDSIVQVYSYPEKEITGFIKKMTSSNYTSVKEGNNIKKFFKIHTLKDELGLTLLMEAPDQKLLQNIKKQMRFIIQTLMHMKLKVHKVKMDQLLLESMTEANRNSCYLYNSQMFFSFYSEFHNDILSYIKDKYVTYKQITFVDSDFMNYPEVSKGALEQYIKGRTKSFKNKWVNFTQICIPPTDYHQMFYSDEDTPLGNYILKKLTYLDKKCTYCCRPNYLHTDIYYSTDQYVRVWAESMIVDQDQFESNCYSSFTSQDQALKNQEMEMIFTYLEKNPSKDKLKCFIECLQCQEPLSSRQNVYKADLEFSTLSFVHNMFKGSTETIIRENNLKKPNLKGKTSICPHMKKVRVFELGQKSVKFFVGKYVVNRQCILTPTGRQMFLKSKENKAIITHCMLESGKIDKLMSYLFEQLKFIAEISKNTKFDNIVKNPRTSFIKAKHSIVGNPNVRLSQAQCIDIILPELVEEVSKINNIAQLMLNMKRITSYLQALKVAFSFAVLLKRCYVIINQLKKSVKKRQLDQKFIAKDFDNDLMMEEIDINQYINETSSVETDSQCTNSQVSKGQLFSNYQGNDTTTVTDVLDYGWLQPYSSKDEYTLNRVDRKTQSNILAKRANKMSDDDAYKLFKMLSSAISFDQGYFELVPCYINKPTTLIAAALNSKQHKECIDGLQFSHQLIIKISKYLENEQAVIDSQQIKKLAKLLDEQERKYDIHTKIKKDLTGLNMDITLLFPNQFQVLRRKNNIPIDMFISSIAGAQAWLATGGKSGSSFMRSYNDLLVIKKIKKDQFVTFRKFLPKYFTHLHEGSLLTPIYGAFIIDRGMISDYYIVMENLFFGMKDWHLYDFKGSVTRRFSRPPVIPLDVNFLVDRFSEPIFCKDNVLQHLNATVEYLCQNNVIDYSLILVVEIENNQDYYLDGNRFQLGVVDYMREYGKGEWVENMWKGPDATVVEPEQYKARMLKNINRYFAQIPI